MENMNNPKIQKNEKRHENEKKIKRCLKFLWKHESLRFFWNSKKFDFRTFEACLKGFTMLKISHKKRWWHFWWFLKKLHKNELGMRFIKIGLQKSGVAAASVVEGPSRCSNEGVKSVDVYKTSARSIIFTTSEAHAAGWPSPAFNAPEPHSTNTVWEINLIWGQSNLRR